MAEADDVPSIMVQISGTNQYVQVFIDELPDDVQDVLDLLRAELAPLEVWHAFAVEYYRQGYESAFREILKEAKEGFVHYEQIKKFTTTERKQFDKARLNIILALAADQMEALMTVFSTNDKARKNELIHEVKNYFSQADKIDTEFKLTWACKALYEIATAGEEVYIEKSEYWSDMLLKESRKKMGGGTMAAHIPTLLLKASMHFQRGEKAMAGMRTEDTGKGGVREAGGADDRRKKEFETALRYYESVLRVKPDCDPTVRLGIGLCCARLGQTERARAAFHRVLALTEEAAGDTAATSGAQKESPGYVDAKLGLILLDLAAIPKHASDRTARQQKAARELVALAADGAAGCRNPMVLNHAANAAFWQSFRSFDRVRCCVGTKEEKGNNLTVAVTHGSPTVTVTLHDVATKVQNDALDATGKDADKDLDVLADAVDDGDAVVDAAGGNSSARELPKHVNVNAPVRIGSPKQPLHGEALRLVAQEDGKVAVPGDDGETLTLTLSKPWDGDTASGQRLFCPNYKLVENRAGSAYWFSQNKEIKAESYYLLGRTDHARRNYVNAERYYHGAIKQSANFAPAHYGLAQMQMHKNEYSKAIESLEKAVRAMPDALEALYLLGKLHLEQAVRSQGKRDHKKERDSKKTALEYVDRAKAVDPTHPEVWLLRGQLLQSDPLRRTDACESYARAVALMNERAAKTPDKTAPAVPSSVLTNLGTLQHELGHLEAARDSLVGALEADYQEFKKTQDTEPPGKKRHRTLYISEPANSVFWEWRELPGTVSAPKGANVLTPSEDLTAHNVDKNSQLRLSFNKATLLSRVSSVTGVIDIDLGGEVDGHALGGANVSSSSSSKQSSQGLSLSEHGGSLRMEVPMDATVTASAIPIKGSVPAPLTSAKIALKVLRLPLQPSNVTTAFNLAVVQEELGEWYAALELYKAILAKFPSHRDAKLRVSNVHLQLGQASKAQAHLERIVKELPKDPLPPALLGALHMDAFHENGKSTKLEAAQNSFQSIQKLETKLQKDPYACLSVANIYFGNLHRTTDDNYRKELKWARLFYESSLKNHRDNVFAANGMGMILAEEGNLGAAKDIFSRIKSVSGDMAPDAVVNLGHILVKEEKYLEAAKTYESVLRKAPHYGKDPELLLLAANAHYEGGRHFDSLRCLSRALRSNPQKVELWSNVAVVQHSYAVELFNRNVRPDRASQSIVRDIEAAQDYARSALKIFKWLLGGINGPDSSSSSGNAAAGTDNDMDIDVDAGEKSSSSSSSSSSSATKKSVGNDTSLPKSWAMRLKTQGIDEKKLTELVGHCERALEEAPERIRKWKEYDEQQAAIRAQREAAAAAAKAEAEAAKEEEAKRRAEEKKRIAERAKIKQQQLEEVSNIERMMHASQETRVNKKSKKDDGEDQSVYGDSQMDSGANDNSKVDFGSSDEDEPPTATAANSAAADLGLDSDDDDDDEPRTESVSMSNGTKRSAPAADVGLDSDDEEDNISPQQPAKRLKRKVVVDSDSDENEFDTGAPATAPQPAATTASALLGLDSDDEDM